MGADIHSFAEVKTNDKWEIVMEDIFSPNDSFGKTSEPFAWRSYGMFRFLADVRNYSHVPCITGEPRGLPIDSEYLNGPSKYNPEKTIRQENESDWNWHSQGYILLKELLEFDYDKEFEDLRYTKTEGNVSNGASVHSLGEGEIVTFRSFLGNSFFEDIEVLKTLGEPDDVRVVFWFDN